MSSTELYPNVLHCHACQGEMDWYTSKRVEIHALFWHENKCEARVYHYHAEHSPFPEQLQH